MNKIDIGLIQEDGTTAYVTTGSSGYASYITPIAPNYSLYYGLTVKVGSGTTEPTIDDYCMTSNETSNFTQYTVTSSTSVENASVVISFAVSGVNNTGSAITISEIGIYKSFLYKSANDTSNVFYQPTMLVHNLLDDIITVQPGSSFQFLYKWTES